MSSGSHQLSFFPKLNKVVQIREADYFIVGFDCKHSLPT